MSETETHKGKLIPLTLNGVSMEERAKDACEKFGFKMQSWHDNWLDCLSDEGYRKLYVYNDIIYEIHDTAFGEDDIYEATENDDHSIDYFIKYYNGGASFDEVIDCAINNIKK